MAIRSYDEFSEILRTYVGDRDDDASISIIEDFADSRTDWEKPSDWEEKYKTLDKEWRTRYMNRFYGKPDGETPDAVGPMRTDTDAETTHSVTKFEELFKED